MDGGGEGARPGLDRVAAQGENPKCACVRAWCMAGSEHVWGRSTATENSTTDGGGDDLIGGRMAETSGQKRCIEEDMSGWTAEAMV
mmetsp:Transcript_27224/g.71744  ORF Transcript_27224/g.71744 Transcript_27224/m.71744 type:complete len:86 (+) Transcript_27224:126-383(+)